MTNVYTRAAKALSSIRGCASGEGIKENLTRANLALIDAGELARLREALEMIRDDRGICSGCGRVVKGPPGKEYCDCSHTYAVLLPQDPRELARAALPPEEKQG